MRARVSAPFHFGRTGRILEIRVRPIIRPENPLFYWLGGQDGQGGRKNRY